MIRPDWQELKLHTPGFFFLLFFFPSGSSSLPCLQYRSEPNQESHARVLHAPGAQGTVAYLCVCTNQSCVLSRHANAFAQACLLLVVQCVFKFIVGCWIRCRLCRQVTVACCIKVNDVHVHMLN